MPRILITGTEWTAGLAAVRALADAGFEPWAAVMSPTAYGARSRATAGTVAVPDPRRDPDGFADALAAAARRIGAAAILPGTEPALFALSGHLDAFPATTAVGAAPERTLNRATDKAALALLGLRAGLESPPTRLLVVDKGKVKWSEVDFPAVVKPLSSEVPLGGGQLRRVEVRRVENPQELTAALCDLPDGLGLVQPFIEGRIRTVNGVAWNGRIVAATHQVGHRIYPNDCGQLCYAETVARDVELERSAEALLGEVGWSGIFNLQLIESGDRLFVIDLNPRLYYSLGLAVAAGLNLPAIWVSLLLDLPYEAEGYRVGMRFRGEKDDARSLLNDVRAGRRRAVTGFLPRRNTTHGIFDLRDPAPLLRQVIDLTVRLRLRPEPRPEPAAAQTAAPAAREKTSV